MRNAAIAILALAVLGLWSVNLRLSRSERLLEERLAAAEKKSRPKAATPIPSVGIAERDPMPSPAPVATALPEPVARHEDRPPSRPAPLPEELAPLEVEPAGFDLRSPVVEGQAFLTGATFRLEESSGPWETLLAVDSLSEAQRAQIESLRQSHDAEAQPHKELLRGLEERYVDSAKRVLTPEQQARQDSLGLSRTVYKRFFGTTGEGAALVWSIQEHR